MNITWRILFVILLSFPLSSICTTPTSSQVNEQALSLGSYMYTLGDATEKYLQNHPAEEPEIKCKDCAQKKLSLGEFSGGLVGRALNDLVEGTNNCKETNKTFEEFTKLLSDATPSELVIFMIQTANNMKYTCPYCGGNSWENV